MYLIVSGTIWESKLVRKGCSAKICSLWKYCHHPDTHTSDGAVNGSYSHLVEIYSTTMIPV